jgi:hypothetical protein
VNTHNGDDFVAIVAAEGGEIAVFDSTHIDLGNAGGEGDFFAAAGLGIFGLGDGTIDFYDQFHLHQHNGPSQVYVDDIVTFHDDAKFDGGNGYDEIFFIATYFGDLEIKNFESVGP